MATQTTVATYTVTPQNAGINEAQSNYGILRRVFDGSGISGKTIHVFRDTDNPPTGETGSTTTEADGKFHYSATARPAGTIYFQAKYNGD